MITVKELLTNGRDCLNLDVFPEREEELVRITMDLFKIPRHELSLSMDNIVSDVLVEKFNEIINQRKTGKPLAYILGYCDFYHHRFPVSPKTLIPRYDTENLIEEVRKFYQKDDEFTVLDIGTGTGAIAISLGYLFPNALIKGIDIYDEPFKNSQKFLNVSSEKISVEKIDFLDQSTWKQLGSWDCIVSNPPYLNESDMDNLDRQVKNFEPSTALYAHENGMAFYQAIAEFTQVYLNKKGRVFLEIDYKYPMVIDIFQQYTPMTSYSVVNDLSGLPRVLVIEY